MSAAPQGQLSHSCPLLLFVVVVEIEQSLICDFQRFCRCTMKPRQCKGAKLCLELERGRGCARPVCVPVRSGAALRVIAIAAAVAVVALHALPEHRDVGEAGA